MKNLTINQEMINDYQMEQVVGGDLATDIDNDFKYLCALGLVAPSHSALLFEPLSDGWKKVGVDCSCKLNNGISYEMKYSYDGHEISRENAWKIAAQYYNSAKK